MIGFMITLDVGEFLAVTFVSLIIGLIIGFILGVVFSERVRGAVRTVTGRIRVTE